MHIRCALHESENKVSFAENSRAYFPAMVAAEILLVDGRSRRGQFSCFLKQIDVITPSFDSLGLGVHCDSRRVVHYVRW